MQKLSNLLVENPEITGLSLAAMIVVFGLLVYGFGDLLKFTPKRVWAISGVVFRESIRRKILWLTPILMLGIVALTGLQQPDDALDAIRQTLQFSLFASGLLVVVSGVMLACTNLPRDIDTKVIFTIVTKPTTRFEIVLGKILGFARVTGSILILMGLFTWAYAHWRASSLQRDIAHTLSQASESDYVLDRLTHLQREGLLDTRQLAYAERSDVIAQRSSTTQPTTVPASDPTTKWISTGQNAFVPFRTTPDDLVPQGFNDPAKGEAAPNPGEAGVVFRVKVAVDRVGSVETQPAFQGPLLPDPDAVANPYGAPTLVASIVDPATDADVVGSAVINGGKPIALKQTPDGKWMADIVIDRTAAPGLANVRAWALVFAPANDNYLIGVAPGAARLIVPGNGATNFRTIEPLKDPKTGEPGLMTRGGAGRSGRLLDGPKDNYQAVSLWHFKGVAPKPGDGDMVALELQMDVERLDDDSGAENTQLEVRVANAETGTLSPAVYVTPEKNKIIYADFPASAFKGGAYDIQLRTVTPGHAVALQMESVAVVQSRHSFGINLAKALLTQWMLSILVVTVGFCCSTFLSWPIAIVLSLTLLMGRWAVDQVSDSLQAGIGATMATDSGITDPMQARVISTTFDGLARMLNFIAKFLPNIDSFSTIEQVQRGVLIPLDAVLYALLVLTIFGLPLVALSYIVLRNKEVAP